MGSFASVNLNTSKIINDKISLNERNHFTDNFNMTNVTGSNSAMWDSQMKRESINWDRNSMEITETVLITNKITFKRKINSEFNLEYLYNIKIAPHLIEKNNLVYEQEIEQIEDDLSEINASSDQIEDKKIFKINRTKDWINKHKIEKAKIIKKKYANNDIGISSSNIRLRRSMRNKFSRRSHVPIYEIEKIQGIKEEIVGVPNLIGTKLHRENSKNP